MNYRLSEDFFYKKCNGKITNCKIEVDGIYYHFSIIGYSRNINDEGVADLLICSPLIENDFEKMKEISLNIDLWREISYNVTEDIIVDYNQAMNFGYFYSKVDDIIHKTVKDIF